ncbi:MAG: ACT domain-containing protein [bacterium]|nr:ACT domain-containing protein [bacterium]
MERELAIVTVIGKDKTGIVAHISKALYDNQVNIEDMNQSIMEGFFVMGMLVDISHAPKKITEIRRSLESVGEKIGVLITIQHEEIFNAIYRV